MDEDRPAPESWSSWSARAIAEALGIRKKREEGRALSMADKIAALERVVYLGIDAQSVLNNRYFREELMPWWRGECDEALRPWAPGKDSGPFNAEGVQARYFYESGAAASMSRVLTRLSQVVEEGHRAEAEVRRLREVEQTRKEMANGPVMGRRTI